MFNRNRISTQILVLTFFFVITGAMAETTPFDEQVAEQITKLQSPDTAVRAGAAEALGYLRAYAAADVLVSALSDDSVLVRREAAMTLAWCGGRDHVAPLLKALEDSDWVTRQAAWVSLTNLTGMEFPFDALATPEIQHEQANRWRTWWADVPAGEVPSDVLALLQGAEAVENLAGTLSFERGVRALGALGGPEVAQVIHGILAPYTKRGEVTSAEKMLVQAGLRSLGRLRHPASLLMLIDFLQSPQWARYAADALGDYGSEDAAMALMVAYPRYGRDLEGERPKEYPLDDWPNLSPADRMFETPFAIAYALARLRLSDEDTLAALRRLVPLLVANLPSDYDAAMLYEPEAHQVITAHLLERAGLRRVASHAALNALGAGIPADRSPYSKETKHLKKLATRLAKDGVYAVDEPYMEVTSWLPTFCQDPEDIPTLIEFLEHDSGWVRINAAKALMFMGAQEAVAPLSKLLAESNTEASYGYFGGHINYETVQGQDEYDGPVPKWREAYIRALGRLGATQCVPLIAEILTDEDNSLGILYAAALVLDELGSPEALLALEDAEVGHPYHSIRLVAREALWRRDALASSPAPKKDTPASRQLLPASENLSPGETSAIVFISGDNKMPNQFQIDPWRQTYSTTDTGPTYRLGHNLHLLKPATPDGKVTPLTHFKDGFVADCEVSWDGDIVIFARRGGKSDPWWHIWEMNVDGTNLRQITSGPYHDVQPAYLPDGRIVFSSSRIGLRDEYHGYLACGLSVMNSDGSDIHCIGFNLGGDREPAVLEDGRIVFSRLELFYSRLKTELIVEAVFPDGTNNVTLYGPERREFWRQATQLAEEKWWGEAPPRHRVLRMTQPQPFGQGRVLCASTAGLTVTGPGRNQETVLPHDKNMAVTTPYPLGDGRILCAATVKDFERTGEANAKNNDLGLYIMDAVTGELTPLYNDPLTAEFEARPVRTQPRPPILPDAPRQNGYTGRLLCSSALNSQEKRVQERGKLVRIIEGQPIVTRHRSHRSKGGPAWKNHTGTLARVLGTVPLAADGSFHVEVPSDRLIHVQVLDSDRRVVGNQQIWMYTRPGETRSCVGCHEKPDTAPPLKPTGFVSTAQISPIPCLPTGGEFTYRAKVWNKGTLTDEGEERTRTTHAVNLLGRY